MSYLVFSAMPTKAVTTGFCDPHDSVKPLQQKVGVYQRSFSPLHY